MRLPAVRAAGGGQCMMQAAARVFGMEPGGAVTAPAYDSGTPTVLTLWAGTRGCLVCLPAVRAAGGGRCMMLEGGWGEGRKLCGGPRCEWNAGVLGCCGVETSLSLGEIKMTWKYGDRLCMF